MTKLKTLLIAAALTAITGTANASDAPNVSFTYDNGASVEANIEAFKSQAKKACKQAIQDAGYRVHEIPARERRACESDLVKRAIDATKNDRLIAAHKFDSGKKQPVRQYADK